MADRQPASVNGAEAAAELDNGPSSPSSSGALAPPVPEGNTLQAMLLQEQMEALGMQMRGQEAKKRYAFWETQPVAQFDDEEAAAQEGPIDEPKSIAHVRQDPYNLPAGYEWTTCDVNDKGIVEEIFQLLTLNYVEDDDNMFRFKYSQEFLQWALQPPGYQTDWVVGVRVAGSRKLVAFITAVPAHLRASGTMLSLVEINFLCVHKKLRSKRLAPVLIKEITRRVNLTGVWQAAYTAGVVLPKPVATAQYWHRSLNPAKLIGVGFSRLQPRMTMARTLKLYKLPAEPATPGIRPLERRDVPQVTELLASYLQQYALAPIFTEADVEHYLMPVEDVVDSYVVEDEGGKLTDMLSYYTLPSTVIGNAQYSTLKAAFMYYTVPAATPALQLMQDALILAHANMLELIFQLETWSRGHDVFNALDIFNNASFLKELKFGVGDGRLRYYLYNWRMHAELLPSQVGLVLL